MCEGERIKEEMSILHERGDFYDWLFIVTIKYAKGGSKFSERGEIIWNFNKINIINYLLLECSDKQNNFLKEKYSVLK